MAMLGEITHTTTYRYTKPVTFGTHRAMFLPRRGACARLLGWSAETSPPSKIHWITDARSNAVTVMEFSEPSSELTFIFQVRGVYFGIKGIESFPLAARAEDIPVQYSPDEWTDLAGYLRPHADDPDGSLAAWTKSFVAGDKDQTIDVLHRVLRTFRESFSYSSRETEGTQSPGETLRTRSGTCRDYAWLMIETLRRLGLASRFVSGYLYDQALDGGAIGMTGSGSTHAWVQVFLPGAGWLDYDPTNQINAGFDLILHRWVRQLPADRPVQPVYTSRPAPNARRVQDGLSACETHRLPGAFRRVEGRPRTYRPPSPSGSDQVRRDGGTRTAPNSGAARCRVHPLAARLADIRSPGPVVS